MVFLWMRPIQIVQGVSRKGRRNCSLVDQPLSAIATPDPRPTLGDGTETAHRPSSHLLMKWDHG
jgi:hypothetical protein